MQQLLSLPVNQRAISTLLTPFYFLFQSKKLLLRLAMLVMSVGMMSAVVGQATVTSDKPDYAPRSNAVFTGAGFQAFEQVQLKVKNLNSPCNTITTDSSYLPWTVTADANGVFVTNWTVCDCPGDSLRLKATGLTSARIAYAYFTDGRAEVQSASPSPFSPNNSANVKDIVTIVGFNNSAVGGNNSLSNFNIRIRNSANVLVWVSSSINLLNGSISNFDWDGTYSSGLGTGYLPDGIYTAIAANNTNESANPASITKQIVIDNTNPTISFQNNINVVNGGGVCGAVVSWPTPTVTDANPDLLTQTAGPVSGSTFPVGTTTVTYEATDAAGNTSTTSFTVTVVDNTAPVIAGTPSTVTVNTGVGRTTCDQVATWTAPTASDNCAGTVSVSSTHNPGDVFPVGNTTVTYTFTDAANNQSQTSFTVTVVDNTAPVIAGTPSTVTVNTGVGRTTCDQVATWTAPTASDNCAGTVGVSSSHNPGDVFSVGSTIVTYTFTDANNNQSQTSFTVTVVDNTAPVLNDPANVTGINDAGFCYKVVVLSAPSATDNCGISVAGVTASGIPADNKFPVGTTTVIWSVTDIHGHTSTQTQDVTITNAAPVVSVTGPTSPQQINSLVTITIFHGDNNVTSATINWDDNSPLESVAPGNPSLLARTNT
jgi:hypothetical protein